MKPFFRTAIFILLFLVLLATLVFIYKRSQKKPVIYETHTISKNNIVRKVVATGSVVPEKQIEITPKISGVIESINVEAGDMVSKGDILARIAIVPNMINQNAAESRVRQAEINLDDAQREYERNKKLVENDVISEVEFQQFKLRYNSALEEVQAAKDNLLLIKKGVTQKTKSQTNTLIRSTINGMVLDVPIKEGTSVIESNNFNNGTIVAEIADMSKMIFEGVVDESEVDKLKLNMPIRLTVGAIENKEFKANITYISPKGSEVDGSIQFDIKATVELLDDAFIRAGYSANANIIIDERKDVWVINEGLLQFDEKGAFVEVEIAEQVFEKRYIKTGLSDGINAEILSGIDENDNIKQWDVSTTYDDKKGKSKARNGRPH